MLLYYNNEEALKIKTVLDMIPQRIASYYRTNEVSMFSCSRPIRRPKSELAQHQAREFLELYTEKTIFYTEENFPCRSRRSRIVQMITFELKPIENAIIAIRTKTRQLEALQKQFSSYQGPKGRRPTSILNLRNSFNGSSSNTPLDMNTNPFTMALKGAIDAPVNGGIPMYKAAFISPDRSDIDSTPQLRGSLQESIDEQVM